MPVKSFSWLVFGCTVFMGFTVWWLLRTPPSLKKKEFIHVLCMQKDLHQSIKNAVLVTYYSDGPYLHVYQVNPSIEVAYQEQTSRLFANDPKDTKIFLESMLNLKIDGVLSLNEVNTMKLLHQLGAIPFFNLRSDAVKKGEVVLLPGDYNAYMKGIDDPLMYREVAMSVWMSFFYHHFLFLKEIHNPQKVLRKHIRLFGLQGISKKNVLYVVDHWIRAMPEVFFFKNAMNVEEVLIGEKKAIVPLQKGKYDAKKLSNLFDSFRNKTPSISRFPITVQVKNATDHKRLAARTAGILRVKRCLVKEYLNAEMPLQRSVLLDRTGSILKRRYMMAATKTSNVYFSFDYIDNFDFTLYIGKDYYAIPLLKAE